VASDIGQVLEPVHYFSPGPEFASACIRRGGTKPLAKRRDLSTDYWKKSAQLAGRDFCGGTVSVTPNGARLLHWTPGSDGVELILAQGAVRKREAMGYEMTSTPSSVRGHRFVRYADDCNIYVRSERAGQRVMESVSRFIMQKLKVNEAKSAVARPQDRKLLGFSFTNGPEVRRIIAPQALDRFKRRIREVARRTKSVSMETKMEVLAPYLRGWRSYFGFCETPEVLLSLTRWVRLRSRWGFRRGSHATPRAADTALGIWHGPRPSQGVSQCLFSVAWTSLVDQGALA
jgi:hypothetical protein